MTAIKMIPLPDVPPSQWYGHGTMTVEDFAKGLGLPPKLMEGKPSSFNEARVAFDTYSKTKGT